MRAHEVNVILVERWVQESMYQDTYTYICVHFRREDYMNYYSEFIFLYNYILGGLVACFTESATFPSDQFVFFKELLEIILI